MTPTQQVVMKLLEKVIETDCGMNQICYHKEWYEELKGESNKQ
jgi:hypothetical protein